MKLNVLVEFRLVQYGKSISTSTLIHTSKFCNQRSGVQIWLAFVSYENNLHSDSEKFASNSVMISNQHLEFIQDVFPPSSEV